VTLELERVDACNLCGSPRLRQRCELTGALSSARFGLVECVDCGLLFINPRLSENANLALYDADYFEGRGFDMSVNYGALAGQAALRQRESRAIIDKLALLRRGQSRSVLDVGCGVGDLLLELEAAGYTDVTGVELSEHGARIARQRTRARIMVGDLSRLDLSGERFDLINATEVVEHVRDPSAFFGKVAELLAPDGVFVYSTGNARGLYARVLGKHWPYLHPEGHLFYYSPRTMHRYLEQAGLASLHPHSAHSWLRRGLLRAEDEIAFAQLLYVGQSDHGLKGQIFRAAARVSRGPVRRAVNLVVGKYAMPIGVKGSLASFTRA
jgi:2-polyprenyl-3-methyl-5-hydroxy-6-metoxy-1,4-benzoquinol methylase